jgi:hypothetical protein
MFIALEYTYVYQSTSTGGGEMRLNASLRRKDKLDSLTIWIEFLDESGKRIGRNTVYASGAYKGVANRSFEVEFKVPPQASQFGFTSTSKRKRERF